MKQQKIKRVCTVSPVNTPGKHDTNLRHFNAGAEWTLAMALEPHAPGVLIGLNIGNVRGEQVMFVPMSNIASIDYE